MPMLHVTTRRCKLAAADHQALARCVEKVAHRLRGVAPDRVHVTVAVTRFANRPEFTGSVRVATGDALYAAKRNTEPTAHALINAAFRDIEDQLQRRQAARRPA